MLYKLNKIKWSHLPTVGGKRPGGPCQFHIGPRAQSKENPSSAMEGTLLSMNVAEDKGGNLSLVVTLQVIPQNRNSTKAEKDNGENGNVKGKGCHDFVQCLVPDIAMFFCLYNHSQQLEGRADGISTYPRNPIQEEGNYYKKGVEGDRQRGLRPPDTPKAPKKAPRIVSRTNPLW